MYQRSSFIQNLLSKHYSRCIVNPTVQVIILVLFIMLTAFAAWGTSRIKSDFNIEYFVNDDHKLQDYYNMRDTYFGGSGEKAEYYSDTTADLLTETLQNEFYDTLSQLQSNRWVVQGSVTSWYFNFLSFIDAGSCTSCTTNCKNGNIVKAAEVGGCLKEFFASSSGASLVGADVVPTYNSGNTQVVSIQASKSSFIIVSPATAFEGVDTLT